MDRLPEVYHTRLAFVILCKTDIHLKAYLLHEKTDQSKIEIKKTLIPAFKDSEELILIILEICRHTISRYNGPLMLLHPRGLVIYFYLTDRKLMGSALVNDRERKGLDTFRAIEPATVAVRLLLEVLAGLDINDRRRQFE